MKEDYVRGKIDIKRNFNKRGGKFFYVIYRKDDLSTLDWLGRIYFVKKLKCWRMDLENNKQVSEDELKFIREVIVLIEGELGK